MFGNGIALSPTLHRAFDRRLVSVSEDYRVLVYPRLRDHYPAVDIEQFNGQGLILPQDSRFYPSREKLGEHRKRKYEKGRRETGEGKREEM